jgi:hypothetical protein
MPVKIDLQRGYGICAVLVLDVLDLIFHMAGIGDSGPINRTI